MIIRSLLAAVAILVCSSPAFAQFDQFNNRLSNLAERLSREANEFADQNYRSYVGGTRNLRRDIEAAMNSQQFAASAQLFNRMVTDRRQRADLRDAFEMVRTAATSVERYNLQRNTWNNVQRLMSEISRELGSEGGGGGGGQYPPDTGRGGRMTWPC